MKSVPHVYLALPSRPGENIALGLMQALWTMGDGQKGEGEFRLFDFRAQPMSLLNLNFNTLWVAARNCRTAWFKGHEAKAKGVPLDANPYRTEQWGVGWEQGWRHEQGSGPGPVSAFVMCHSDVLPVIVLEDASPTTMPMPWLRQLVAEWQKTGADLLTTVIPLKDDSGDTSTGVMNWATGQIRKLSLRECLHDLPQTFDARDAKADCLLTNTGLWIADLTQPWARRICFRSYDTILLGDDGIDQAVSTGEDWLMGIDLYRMGLKVKATTRIKVDHQGTFRYPNYVAFGKGAAEGKWGTPWCVEPPNFWHDPRFRGDGLDAVTNSVRQREAA